jgi:tetratricopeptide (TPR) repeat protein
LIYGEAYCDFQARTLNALLAVAGIPSRYAMLMDNSGISVHTLNEVLLNKKWCTFDTLTNFAFQDESGSRFSLAELSDDAGLIKKDKKIVALHEFDKGYADDIIQYYARVFPMSFKPRRSHPSIRKAHILDHISDAYFKVLRNSFFNLYQDIYLKFKKKYAHRDDFKLFFMARNYHLARRDAKAIKYYNALLDKYPDSKFIEDAVFFSAVLYYEMGNFTKSRELLNAIHDNYSKKWKTAAHHYLGLIYESVGDIEASISAYRESGISRASADTIEKIIRYKTKLNR